MRVFAHRSGRVLGRYPLPGLPPRYQFEPEAPPCVLSMGWGEEEDTVPGRTRGAVSRAATRETTVDSDPADAVGLAPAKQQWIPADSAPASCAPTVTGADSVVAVDVRGALRSGGVLAFVVSVAVGCCSTIWLSSQRDATAFAGAASWSPVWGPAVVAASLSAEPGATPGAATAAVCRATLVSEPGGVAVSWNDRALGVSPVRDVIVPCGDAFVTWHDDRFHPETTAARAHPGGTVDVSQRLRWRRRRLTVTYEPADARVRVDGRRVARSGAGVDVLTQRSAKVVASHPDYKRFSLRVRIDDAHRVVQLRLEPKILD